MSSGSAFKTCEAATENVDSRWLKVWQSGLVRGSSPTRHIGNSRECNHSMTCSQCRLMSTSETWSECFTFKISCAAAFRADFQPGHYCHKQATNAPMHHQHLKCGCKCWLTDLLSLMDSSKTTRYRYRCQAHGQTGTQKWEEHYRSTYQQWAVDADANLSGTTEPRFYPAALTSSKLQWHWCTQSEWQWVAHTQYQWSSAKFTAVIHSVLQEVKYLTQQWPATLCSIKHTKFVLKPSLAMKS